MNVYQENGYQDRHEYLSCLAEDYGVDLFVVVVVLADTLGPNEDFDGLIVALDELESW